jgi:hypothetical protein
VPESGDEGPGQRRYRIRPAMPLERYRAVRSTQAAWALPTASGTLRMVKSP